MPAPEVHLMRHVARSRFNDFALRSSRRVVRARYEEFIDGITETICAAWRQWQSQAVLSGVVVQGTIASGGKVLGPAWEPLILARAPAGSAWARRRSAAVARTLGEAWMTYVSTIRVPALAPAPAPDAATPLKSLFQVTTGLDKMSLLSRMVSGLGTRPQGLDVEMFECLLEAFLVSFRRWRRTATLR